MISDRTALKVEPAADGSIFLTSSTSRQIELPGLKLRSRKGPGPLPGDQPFMGVLHLSSRPRAYLDNLAPSRARQGVARCVSQAELEGLLDRDLRIHGSDYLNRIRDDAARLARKLDRVAECTKLNRLIGALLGTQNADLVSPVAAARALGRAYDPARVELFTKLADLLSKTDAPYRMQRDEEEALLPFFEAYFSNFIEVNRICS